MAPKKQSSSYKTFDFKVTIIEAFDISKGVPYQYICDDAKSKLYTDINNSLLKPKFCESFKKEDCKPNEDYNNILNASALFIGLVCCHEIIKLVEKTYEKLKNTEAENQISEASTSICDATPESFFVAQYPLEP